jgi:ApbE superfamily uncharacterized protein (UPF0280 family)
MAIHFNTLRYVETLIAGGFTEAQAKAEADALATALGESSSGNLASKDDVNSLKLEMADIKSDLKLLKWGILLIVGIVLPGALKSIGLIH